ncbi:MAG: lysophospholipid acyltransferase family protein [Vicinamibacterales bacterium]
MRLPFHWWRTVFFLIPAIGVYTIVLGVLSIGSVLVGGKGRFAHRCARLWSWLILTTTGVFVTVDGLEHLPADGAFLFVANHQSFYDIPIIFWNVPFDLRIIAKASLGRFPFIGGHLRRTGHILVERNSPGSSTFRQVQELFARRQSLLVFPEGTRSLDGRLGRFRGGIFLLAIDAGLPIVPLAVRGSRHVMKKGQLMTCPADVGLSVFSPISTKDMTRDDAKALATRVQAIIETAVASDMDATAPVGPMARQASA